MFFPLLLGIGLLFSLLHSYPLFFGVHQCPITETEIPNHSSTRAAIAALYVFLPFYEAVFRNPLKYGLLAITTFHLALRICEVLMSVGPLARVSLTMESSLHRHTHLTESLLPPLQPFCLTSCWLEDVAKMSYV
jgi:hypothetical protein